MLIDSEMIKQTKEQIEVMQAFVDGKEIEFKLDSYKGLWKVSATPTWDFSKYKYRVKSFKYPIYKKSKEHGTVVKFTGLDYGEYMTKTSSFNIGDYNNNLVEHTDNKFWEDYTPEFVYPIYKRLKNTPETVVKFHSIDTGIYISVRKGSIYRPGDAANNMAPHTDSIWEDCDHSRLPKFHTCSKDELVEHGIELPNYMLNQLDEFEIERLKRKKAKLSADTIELFEVMVYCDIMKEFMIKQVLYSDEELENYKNSIKTGRSFIINKETKQVIKVNYN